MSFLTKGKAYIIVTTADITEEMVNNTKMNFYSEEDTLRTSNDTLKTLFKVKTPISAVFNGYKWYNLKKITPILDGVDWTISD